MIRNDVCTVGSLRQINPPSDEGTLAICHHSWKASVLFHKIAWPSSSRSVASICAQRSDRNLSGGDVANRGSPPDKLILLVVRAYPKKYMKNEWETLITIENVWKSLKIGQTFMGIIGNH